MNGNEFVEYLKEKYFGKNYEKVDVGDGYYPKVGTKEFLVLTKDWAMGELWHAEDAAMQALRFKVEDDIKVGLFKQSAEEAAHFKVLADFVRRFGDNFDIEAWTNEIVLNAPEWRAIYDYNPNDPVLYFAARNFAGETVADVWMRKVASQPDLDREFKEKVVLTQIEDEGKHTPLGAKVLGRYCTTDESKRKAELGVQIGLTNNRRGVGAMIRHYRM